MGNGRCRASLLGGEGRWGGISQYSGILGLDDGPSLSGLGVGTQLLSIRPSNLPAPAPTPHHKEAFNGTYQKT
jgi:hypothetical protein